MIARKASKKSNFEHGKALRDFLIRELENFKQNKDKVEQCVTHYNAFADDMNKVRKDNKVVNDFLSHLPETAGFLQMDDLEKLLRSELLNSRNS